MKSKKKVVVRASWRDQARFFVRELVKDLGTQELEQQLRMNLNHQRETEISIGQVTARLKSLRQQLDQTKMEEEVLSTEINKRK